MYTFPVSAPPMDQRKYTIQCLNGTVSWVLANSASSDTTTNDSLPTPPPATLVRPPMVPLPPTPTRQRIRKLLVLAGQSNCAGSSIEPSQPPRPIDPRIRQWSRALKTCFDGRPLPYDAGVAGTLIPARHPLQARGICSPLATGFGIEMAEQYLLDHPECDELILMNCAMGGTGFRPTQGWIATWDYTLKEAHVNFALQTFAEVTTFLRQEPEVELLALCWHQGENDLGYWSYPQCLTAFLTRFRQVVGLPNLPLLVGTMASDFKKLNPSGTEYIDTTHKCIAYYMQDFRFALCVNLDEILGTTPDGLSVHFTAKGYVRAGQLYYQALRELWRQLPPPPPSSTTNRSLRVVDTDGLEYEWCGAAAAALLPPTVMVVSIFPSPDADELRRLEGDVVRRGQVGATPRALAAEQVTSMGVSLVDPTIDYSDPQQLARALFHAPLPLAGGEKVVVNPSSSDDDSSVASSGEEEDYC